MSAAGAGAVTDRFHLLVGKNAALVAHLRQLDLDALAVDRKARVRRGGGRHLSHRRLHVDLALRREDARVGEAAVDLERGRRHVELDDLLVAEHPLDAGPRRRRAQRGGRCVHRPLDDVRQPEHRLVGGDVVGNSVETLRRLADLLDGGRDLLAGQFRHEFFPVPDVSGCLEVPRDMAKFAALARQFLAPRRLVNSCRRSRVRPGREAQVRGHGLDGLAPLRPLGDEALRNARDAGERLVLPVPFHPDPEPLLQVPGQGVPVGRAGRLVPAEDRRLVERSGLAVLVLGDVEDEAVGVELRVVVPARSVLEHRPRDLGTHQLDVPALGPCPSPAAVLAHDLVESRPAGIVVRLRDLLAQLLSGDRPHRRDGLVGGEGHVDSRAALLRAGVLYQFLASLRVEPVIETPEVTAVDRAAVLDTEDAARVPPDPVGLFSANIVVGGPSTNRQRVTSGVWRMYPGAIATADAR